MTAPYCTDGYCAFHGVVHREPVARDDVELPFVPEPVLTIEERAALAVAMLDPAFWDEFERLPERYARPA